MSHVELEAVVARGLHLQLYRCSLFFAFETQVRDFLLQFFRSAGTGLIVVAAVAIRARYFFLFGLIICVIWVR
jgi:hypothetical protein